MTTAKITIPHRIETQSGQTLFANMKNANTLMDIIAVSDKHISYDSLTCGLGVAIGCSLTLLLDGKVNDNLRMRIGTALCGLFMAALTCHVKLPGLMCGAILCRPRNEPTR